MRLSIDNINIEHSFKYRMMFIAGAVVHMCFLIVFFVIDVEVLGVINIFSVLLYLLGSFFSISRRTGQMRYGWMIAFYSEIIAHTVACILLIGIDANFYLYAIVILPISIYVLFFSCTIGVFLRTVIIFVLSDLLLVGGAFVSLNYIDIYPYFPLSYSDINFLRVLNMSLAAAMLLGFSMLFSLEVYSLLKKLRAVNSRLEYTATHDALTGLYNRHSIKPVFEKMQLDEVPFCIALGDIDDFKKINDTYGHDCGDAALKMVADILLGGAAEHDIVCRWGGEEMLLILRGGREEALERLSAINESIRSAEVQHEDNIVRLTMTFGFAHHSESETLDMLISMVDKRLYYGKQNGKNVIISQSKP